MKDKTSSMIETASAGNDRRPAPTGASTIGDDDRLANPDARKQRRLPDERDEPDDERYEYVPQDWDNDPDALMMHYITRRLR